ncbi:tetratricopeptide (TPR) repeat protein [Crossiella equi]|uniref:Tetratricopeptide (TPR) repeat protein n=2 Tax=Crossiella equi TaxID=130796 RepID=A0ABS5A592_9PSEU|nr:hypothetical protein [Crossiella equi]MBP2471750.1 tetratricopeptide (TPR) repeat protein [Crossiella equi]
MNERVFHLAQHWFGIGQYDRVLSTLGELQGEDAAGYAAVVLRASALWLSARDAEAVVVATGGIARFGPDPALLQVLGNAQHSLGQWPEAEGSLLAALHQLPTDAGLLCDYGRLCLSAGQVDKAAALADRAAHHDPHAVRVGQLRGLVALARGEDAEAARHTAAHQDDVDTAYQSFRAAAAAGPGNAEYVRAAREARVAAHPLLRPLRPLYRLGPVKVWITFLLVFLGLRLAGLGVVAGALALCWFLYCLYSWVAPPLVRRWLERR